MLKARSFLVVATVTVIAAGCQASPVGHDVAKTDPLFGGQTLGSGHRTESDSGGSAETTMSATSDSDARGGNLFGSGT